MKILFHIKKKTKECGRLIFFIFFGCTSKEDNENKKIVERRENAEEVMNEQDEKIVLLSIAMSTSYDTLRNILLEYYTLAEPDYKVKTLAIPAKEAIKEIAEKYKVSQRKVASFIFLFKYEMSTFDEKIRLLEEEYHEEQKLSGTDR